MDFDRHLSRAVRTSGHKLPHEAKTLGEALDMIDEHLPSFVRSRAHWHRARNQIIDAAETGSQADVYEATSQLVAALEAEGWLDNGTVR